MNTQAIVEPIIESILESISERFVDIKPRWSQDVSSLKYSALVAAISLTLPLLLEAERRRTLETVRKLGEQDIKEEYIERKFHEHPDIKPLNTKKVKEEVKIECKEEYIEEKFNDEVKIEIEMSAVSTPVKQKNIHVFVEKKLVVMEAPTSNALVMELLVLDRWSSSEHLDQDQ